MSSLYKRAASSNLPCHLSTMLPFIMLSLLSSLLLLPLHAKASPFAHVSISSSSVARRQTPPPSYGTVTTTTNGTITRAVINNPPINLWDYKLAADFSSFIDSLAENNNATKVVILSSANPDYFIYHLDIHDGDLSSPVAPPGNGTLILEQLVRTRSNLATLPVIFIAEIDGRATGAGNEIGLQCDIRYAGPGTKLSQLEVSFGLLPGAGGVQFLTALLGRARALEYILSASAVDAVTAATIGWVNRAFGNTAELKDGVTALANRINSFPKQGLGAVKSRVNVQKPPEADLDGDFELLGKLSTSTVSQLTANKFLQLSDNQSKDVSSLTSRRICQRLSLRDFERVGKGG